MRSGILYTRDAPQRALSFLNNEAKRIETQVYARRYGNIQYPRLLPVDTTGPEWTAGVIYYSSDAVAQARWFHGKADDVRHAETMREKFETSVHMAAIGYDYDLQELGQAQLLGIPLRDDKANAARRAAEEFIDKIAMAGDTAKGIYGLTNHPDVTAGDVVADGTGSTKTWSTKTPAQILRDVNSILTGQFTNTFGAEMADTLLLPYTSLLDISTRRLDEANGATITVLDWIQQNNVRTRLGQGELMVTGAWNLDTAGAGGTRRMVAYRREPDVVVLYMPMPFRFLDAWQQGPMRFEVPGVFRISGVEVRRPEAMRYADGI
jgi:hypothetical protein